MSLDQAIAVRPKSIAVLEETLTAKKKWTLLEVNDETEDQHGSINFALEKSGFDDSSRAFITVFYQELKGE